MVEVKRIQGLLQLMGVFSVNAHITTVQSRWWSLLHFYFSMSPLKYKLDLRVQYTGIKKQISFS